MMGGKEPLLTADIREHAGDIDFRNARASYPESVRQIVNRDFVTTNYRQAVDEAAKKFAWPEPASCALSQDAEPNYLLGKKAAPGSGFFYCSGRGAAYFDCHQRQSRRFPFEYCDVAGTRRQRR
jgi:Iron/manganese superoxide dismutases, C-terminal domain